MFWLVVIAITLMVIFMKWASHELHKKTKVPLIKSWGNKIGKRC